MHKYWLTYAVRPPRIGPQHVHLLKEPAKKSVFQPPTCKICIFNYKKSWHHFKKVSVTCCSPQEAITCVPTAHVSFMYLFNLNNNTKNKLTLLHGISRNTQCTGMPSKEGSCIKQCTCKHLSFMHHFESKSRIDNKNLTGSKCAFFPDVFLLETLLL